MSIRLSSVAVALAAAGAPAASAQSSWVVWSQPNNSTYAPVSSFIASDHR
jgi:hypothetical protein